MRGGKADCPPRTWMVRCKRPGLWRHVFLKKVADEEEMDGPMPVRRRRKQQMDPDLDIDMDGEVRLPADQEVTVPFYEPECPSGRRARWNS